MVGDHARLILLFLLVITHPRQRTHPAYRAGKTHPNWLSNFFKLLNHACDGNRVAADVDASRT